MAAVGAENPFIINMTTKLTPKVTTAAARTISRLQSSIIRAVRSFFPAIHFRLLAVHSENG